MIRLVKFFIGLGLLWSLYWYAAGYLVRQSVTAWFQDRAELGWQADFADISTSGYPFRHVTMLKSPALADPANGTAWQADWLILNNPAIWPGKQTLIYPDTVQRLSYFDQTVELQAADMVADLHLKPGTALELDRMAVSAGQWQISAQLGPIVSGKALDVAMQDTGEERTYRFDVLVPEFEPDERLRRLTGSGPALPEKFQTLELDMKVTFDRVWDRRALEERRPQPTDINLRLAQAQWGKLSLFAAGQLIVDGAGQPDGDITVKVQNWRDMLLIAEQSGAIPDYTLKPIERVLELVSRVGGSPEVLDVGLKFGGGSISLGPFPLGPSPNLHLR